MPCSISTASICRPTRLASAASPDSTKGTNRIGPPCSDGSGCNAGLAILPACAKKAAIRGPSLPGAACSNSPSPACTGQPGRNSSALSKLASATPRSIDATSGSKRSKSRLMPSTSAPPSSRSRTERPEGNCTTSLASPPANADTSKANAPKQKTEAVITSPLQDRRSV